MPNLWDNLRRDPFNYTWAGGTKYELHPVTSTKTIQLSEFPLPGTVTVKNFKTMSNLTEETADFASTPPDNFYVDYMKDSTYSYTSNREGTGKVYVNLTSTTNAWVLIKYTGLGKIRLWEDVERSQIQNNTLAQWYETQGFTWSEATSQIASEIVKAAIYNGRSEFVVLTGSGIRKFDIYSTLQSKPYSWSVFTQDANRRGHLAIDSFGNIYASLWNGSSIISYSDISGSVAAYTQIGQSYSASVQIGNFMYFTVDGASTLRRANLRDNTTRDISLPNAWQYGTAVYDGNGYIYLLGNRQSGFLGQNVRINIFDETYSTWIPSYYNFTQGTELLMNGTGFCQNGIIYVYDNQTGKDYNIVYDTKEATAFRQYQITHPTDAGSGTYNFSNIYKSVSGCSASQFNFIPASFEYLSISYIGGSHLFPRQPKTHPLADKKYLVTNERGF
jgi:hypothetical protein